MRRDKLRMAKASLREASTPHALRVLCHFCDWRQTGSSADPLASARRLRMELIAHVEAAHADRFPIEPPPGEVGVLTIAVPGKAGIR